MSETYRGLSKSSGTLSIWENPCYFLRRSVTYLYSRSHDVIDSVFVRLDFFEDGLKLSQSGRGVGKRPAKIIVPASKQLKTRLFTKREPYRVQQVILLYLSAMTSHKPDLSSSIRPWSRKAWKKNKEINHLIFWLIWSTCIRLGRRVVMDWPWEPSRLSRWGVR